jgi:hypothetical protein
MLDALPILLAVLAIAIGWGSLAGRFVFRLDDLGWPLAGLLGIFCLTLLGVVLNLFAPLGPAATAATGLIGCGGFVFRCWTLRKELRLGASGEIALLSFCCAAIGVLHGSEFETGLYHLQTLLWQHASAYPIGAANLDPRLGTNSAWMPFAGMLWMPLAGITGSFCANMLAFLLVLGALLHEARRDGGVLPALMLAVLTLPWGRFLIFQGGSPATDAPGMLLVLFCLSLMPGLMSAREPLEVRRRMTLLILCATLAVTIKLATLPVLLLPVSAGWRRLPRGGLAAAGALVFAWLVRGFFASGCLLFPEVRSCSQSVPWSSSPELIASYALDVRQWARGHPAGADWLAGWVRLMGNDRVVVAMFWLSAAALLLLALLWRRAQLRSHAGALLAVLAGLAFWLVGAPDPRFAYGFILGAPLVLLGAALGGVARVPRSLRVVSLVLLAISGALAAVADNDELPGFWPDIPRAQVHVARASDGSGISVAEQPPGAGAQCWATQPPCSWMVQDGLTVTRLLGRTAFVLRKR